MFDGRCAGATKVLVGAVLQVLVGRVRVHRRHEAALDAERVVEHLGERREAVRRARRVRDDVVALGVVVLLVDAHDERGVLIGRRRGDQHLLGAGRDVLARVGRLREEAGRLDDDVDAQLAPRQVRGVALRERLDRLAVDDDVVVVVVDGGVETTGDRVVLEQVRERLVVGEVVHGDDLEVGALGEGGTEVVAADAAEAVDADLYGHGCLLN